MLQSPRAPSVGQAGARSPTLPRPTQSVAQGSSQPACPGPGVFTLLYTQAGTKCAVLVHE